MGKGETFRQWQMETMQRMLLLSMAFHAMVAGMLLVLPVPFQRALSLPPVYQVSLVTLPAPPSLSQPTEAEEVKPPGPQAPAPPKTVLEELPKPVKPKVATKRLSEPIPAPKKPAPEKAVTKPAEKTLPPESKAAPPAQETAKPKIAALSVPSITAGVDAPDFKFPEYTEKIRWKIGSVWSPPAIEIGHESKEVVISFVLVGTGQIEEVQVEKSSGNTFFDLAALRAVYIASPLPPFPRGFREPHLKVHFSFVLRKG